MSEGVYYTHNLRVGYFVKRVLCKTGNKLITYIKTEIENPKYT